MIIPVKCFTCGKVLGDKYNYYLEKVREKKLARNMSTTSVIYINENFVDKTPEGEVLDILKLTRMCCRRHMLTHVDIE